MIDAHEAIAKAIEERHRLSEEQQQLFREVEESYQSTRAWEAARLGEAPRRARLDEKHVQEGRKEGWAAAKKVWAQYDKDNEKSRKAS